MLNSSSSLPDSRVLSRQLEKVRIELARRQKLKSDRFTRYRADPVGFIEQVLLGFVWSKQKQICESVRDNRYTAVPACHGPGKSAIAGRIGSHWLACHEPGEAFLVTSAPTFQQVRGILWREINKVHAIGRLPGRCNATQWVLDSGELIGFGRAAKDMTSFQGIHAPKVLVILDEGSGISDEIAEGAETLITNDDSRMLIIGNPDDPASAFARACKPGSGYNVIPISAFDTPAFTGEAIPDWMEKVLVSKIWVEERRKKWGEESPLWKAKVLGQFPDVSEDGLIPLSHISAAQALEYEPQPDDPNELGVDVARYGLDNTVIYHRHGKKVRLAGTANKRDLMTVTGKVVQAIRETGANVVKIDDAGLGGGVTDRLRELVSEGKLPAGTVIVAVNVGEGVSDAAQDEHFHNLRTEVNWMMRNIFEEKRIDIDPSDDQLAHEASEIKYKVRSDGTILMESKEDMKKRTHGVSPDYWDALVLAFVPKELGGTVVHTTPDQTIVVNHFNPPKTWARVCAIHMDRTKFSAVWAAIDAEAKVTYLYSNYIAPLTQLAIHADVVRQRGSWIPVIFNHEAADRSKAEGQKLIDRFIDLNLDLYVDKVDRDAAITNMQTVLSGDRLKVSDLCSDWVEQYRLLHRDQQGEVVEGRDQLIQATELLLSSGLSIAAFDTDHVRMNSEEWSRKSANEVTGY